jgi:DNA invertase Pin-like site-specific DNA recombinase
MTAKRAALYLRVSTSDQTVENQRIELDAVAARHGWQVVASSTSCAKALHGANST